MTVTGDVDVVVRDLMRLPWKRGGRGDGGIDCLGVVLQVAHRLGLRLEDPWPVVRRDWLRGELAIASGFPARWRRVHGALQTGDVVVMRQGAAVGIVLQESIVSASKGNGVFRLPIARCPVDEVWRYQP